jgi:TRAP-type C4-dicarboxylate transport system permease small subunit
VIDRTKTARNVAIVLLIAAAVEFLPGGGRAANTFSAVLSLLFAAGLGYMGVRFYREHRVDVYGLGDRHRALLYGALAVGTVTAAAQPRMWQSAFGEFVWFVLIGMVVYTLIAVYRFARTY